MVTILTIRAMNLMTIDLFLNDRFNIFCESFF